MGLSWQDQDFLWGFFFAGLIFLRDYFICRISFSGDIFLGDYFFAGLWIIEFALDRMKAGDVRRNSGIARERPLAFPGKSKLYVVDLLCKEEISF